MRVLAPRGVALVKHGTGWKKTVKPVPDDLDEWTHYLHDASNNPVSQDDRIHPPKHLKWVGSPRYSRHHDHMSSMNACVSAGGRLFYMMDESTRLSIFLQPTWKLIARDAFNGSLLWKREVSEWYNHMQRLKSGPAYMPRKIVAIGDILYASPGLHAPAEAIDAATGETIRTYLPDMEADELVYSDGVLFLVGKAGSDKDSSVDRRAIKGQSIRRLAALKADDGTLLWELTAKVLPLTLSVDDKRVYFHDAEAVVAYDRTNGRKLWASDPMAYWENMASYFAPTLVLHDGIVLFTGGANSVPHRGAKDTMFAISGETGKTLWSAAHPPSGYQSPEDLMVVDGLVWSGETTSGGQSGVLTGRDPWTGEIKKQFPPNVKTYWFHHRCYKARATKNYILMSRTGIEFIDYKKENWDIHHWVRGACLYGIMPANGMVYAPQHPCACYPEAKLNGFSALSSEASAARRLSEEERLQKGPAYDKIAHLEFNQAPHDWPTFRHDGRRSGHTDTIVPADLKEAWRVKLTGAYADASDHRISQPVVANGLVYVSAIDKHTVHALDETTGREVWRFTAGGRVDSSPTIYRGVALFGSADGWVYALKADTGELAWRFLASDREMRMIAYEQIESAWPVHGNILVEDGVAWFASGRSVFLDGGLRVFRLNPITGEKIGETAMNDLDLDGKEIQDYINWLNMPVGKPDILSSDGKHVFMRSQTFNLDGTRKRVDFVDVSQQRGEEMHLFCPSGFLDDSWWHRTYQVFGRGFSGGHSGYSKAGK
ncbi:MAG: PQQ-binding-like beta-propeller repeat protein, partial [Verrucomicrobiota bacterium]